MDKVLPRLVKRGDERGRVFAQKILDHATSISKDKVVVGKVGQSQHINGVAPKSPPDAKRISGLSLKPNTIKTTKTANISDARQSPSKADTKSAPKAVGNDVPITKVKSNHVTAKPTGFFAGLKSASKKPGTSAKLEEGKTG